MSRNISKFQKDCKRYFSSLSARGCTYLYYNLPTLENELILSNADPDHLNTYSLQYLVSIHHLQFKDDFMSNFKKYFFGDKEVEGTYILKTNFLTAAFKDHRVEDIVANINPITNALSFIIDGQTVVNTFQPEELEETKVNDTSISKIDIDNIAEQVLTLAEPKKSMFYDKSIAGIYLNDPHIVNLLLNLVGNINDDCKNIITDNCKHVCFNYPDFSTSITKRNNNWYSIPGYQHGYFSDYNSHSSRIQQLLLIDGIDTPSIREFLFKCKFKEDTEKFHYYIYLAEDNSSVHQLAIYETEDILIKSSRPYNVLPIFNFSPNHNYRHISNIEEVYNESR